MIKVVQCPNCGWYQLSSAVKSFKCHRCGKSKSLLKVKIIKVVRDPVVAREVLVKLNNH